MTMNITHDLHVHTYLSACCRDKEGMTVTNVLAAAEASGLRTVGFSDHLWMNAAVPPSSWYRPQDATQIRRLRNDLAALGPSPVRVSVGCEADMRAPGQFSITPEFAAGLDHVLLACSHFHMKDFIEQPADTSPRAVAEHLVAFFVSGVRSGLATSIAHPFLPIGDTARLDAILGSLSDAELTDALGVAAERRVALEITVGFLPKAGPEPTFSLETPLRLLTLAKTAGCRFTFGTDAHDLPSLDHLAGLQPLVDRLGLTDADLAVH
jgi:histidinol phosphatase-like PHP family hydrolase